MFKCILNTDLVSTKLNLPLLHQRPVGCSPVVPQTNFAHLLRKSPEKPLSLLYRFIFQYSIIIS
jgi:hypothetical protein